MFSKQMRRNILKITWVQSKIRVFLFSSKQWVLLTSRWQTTSINDRIMCLQLTYMIQFENKVSILPYTTLTCRNKWWEWRQLPKKVKSRISTQIKMTAAHADKILYRKWTLHDFWQQIRSWLLQRNCYTVSHQSTPC